MILLVAITITSKYWHCSVQQFCLFLGLMARANKLTLKQYMSDINFEQTDKATEHPTQLCLKQCFMFANIHFCNINYRDKLFSFKQSQNHTPIYHIYLRYLKNTTEVQCGCSCYWRGAACGLLFVISTALNTITEYIQNSHRNTRGAITHQPAPSPGTIALNIKMCAEYLYHNFLCQTKRLNCISCILYAHI